MTYEKMENLKPEEKINFEGADPEYEWSIEKIMRKLLRKDEHFDQDAVYNTLATELNHDKIVDKVTEDYHGSIGEEMIEEIEKSLGE